MALTTDPLFVGCTRPTMVGGVTYSAFILNVIVSAIVFLALNNIFYLAVCIPIHGICYLILANEARTFELLGLWSRTKGRNNMNKRIWKSSSYSPLEPFREPKQNKKKVVDAK